MSVIERIKYQTKVLKFEYFFCNSEIYCDYYVMILTEKSNVKLYVFSGKTYINREIFSLSQRLIKKHGVHSTIALSSAGFHYTGNGDTTRCHTCNLEVYAWKLEMKPFAIHAQRSPDCPFVRSILPIERAVIPATLSTTPVIPTFNDGERPFKRQKTETTDERSRSGLLVEVDTLKQMRRRTFSHWPHRASPSSAQMIDAGFFNCNVGDRIICLYCNLICQQWTPHTDDPWEVHRTLSPKCPYVIATLKQQQTPSIRIVNEQSTRENAIGTTNNDPFRLNDIVYTAACNPTYIEIPQRYTSFATWPNENAPSVDDLVRAGFFYTGTKTIVTCFYCNGSLQNWEANDNPTIEHARWFPHCAYAKQLCGAELYRNIQESKRAQQGIVDFFITEKKNVQLFHSSTKLYL
jgi:hypothetical protein